MCVCMLNDVKWKFQRSSIQFWGLGRLEHLSHRPIGKLQPQSSKTMKKKIGPEAYKSPKSLDHNPNKIQQTHSQVMSIWFQNWVDLGWLRQQHQGTGDLTRVAVNEPPLGDGSGTPSGCLGRFGEFKKSLYLFAICLPSALEQPSNLFKSEFSELS